MRSKRLWRVIADKSPSHFCDHKFCRGRTFCKNVEHTLTIGDAAARGYLLTQHYLFAIVVLAGL